MGREVRRVPADWQHPKDENDHFIPLYGDSFSERLAHWKLCKEKWEQGLRENFFNNTWVPIEDENKHYTFEEWDGDPPEEANYMPDWSIEKRTHYQMYETCTEGTPISPVMKTPEELAKWLADNEASAFGGMTASYEQWLTVCKGKSSVSAAVIDGQMISGVALNALPKI